MSRQRVASFVKLLPDGLLACSMLGLPTSMHDNVRNSTSRAVQHMITCWGESTFCTVLSASGDCANKGVKLLQFCQAILMPFSVTATYISKAIYNLTLPVCDAQLKPFCLSTGKGRCD